MTSYKDYDINFELYRILSNKTLPRIDERVLPHHFYYYIYIQRRIEDALPTGFIIDALSQDHD